MNTTDCLLIVNVNPQANRLIQACRVCGCTDDRACPGGCYWVEHDLCSACAEKLKRAKSGATP